MCNAWNHHEGCDCGFGPPYLDHMSYGPSIPWAARAADDPSAVPRALTELNFESAARERFVSEYQEIAASGLPRASKIDRIKGLLGRRKTIEEESWFEDVLVPLYRFGAPAVEGSTVSYREGEVVIESAGWVIRVEGIGTGHSQEMSASRSGEFTASDGACKEVFVKVRMRVARVRVEEGGRVVGRGIRAAADVPKKEKKVLRGRGCRTVDKALCRERVADPDQDVFEAQLRGDTTADVHSYEQSWTSSAEYSLALQLTKHGLGISFDVRIRRTRELRLAFRLPAGHDYRARICRRSIQWELPFG